MGSSGGSASCLGCPASSMHIWILCRVAFAPCRSHEESKGTGSEIGHECFDFESVLKANLVVMDCAIAKLNQPQRIRS